MKKSILRQMSEEARSRVDTTDGDEAEATVTARRHSSPVISNVGRALTHLGEDTIISLDPSKVERSPFQDRFDSDEEAKTELETLKISIAAEGQKIPVLVRPHPTKSDHYQLAYGHRRLAAIKALMVESERPETVKIKAYIRNLTDRQLIEEQGLENGVRENLTWIEQAMWAVQLKSAGMSHRAICPILGLSEAAVSHLFRVTSAVPSEIIFAIGRAKSVGRPKWTAFAALLKDESNIEAVRKKLHTNEFKSTDGAGRIALAINAASGVLTSMPNQQIDSAELVVGNTPFGRMKSSASGTTITILKKDEAFARWLVDRMPDLKREYDDKSSSSD